MKMSIGSTCLSRRTEECELFYSDESDIKISTVTIDSQATITPETLAKLWMIDEKLAKSSIAKNSHLNRKGASNDLSKHFSTNDRMLRYRRIKSTFFTDTFFATKSGKSARGFTCA